MMQRKTEGGESNGVQRWVMPMANGPRVAPKAKAKVQANGAGSTTALGMPGNKTSVVTACG